MISPPLTADGFKTLALVLLLAAVAFLCLAIDDAGRHPDCGPQTLRE